MPKKEIIKEDPIVVERYPEWIEPLPVHWVNKKMMELVQFYVFNSPCKSSSWGRKSMEDYGWKNYWDTLNATVGLLNHMKLWQLQDVSS